MVFVRVLRHSPEEVWAALTDPVQLRAWAPFISGRDLGRVGDATLTMIDGDVSEDLPASVTRAERPRLLEYTWGTDLVRWELAPIDSGTRLTLEHTVGDREVGAEGGSRLAPLPRCRRAPARRAARRADPGSRDARNYGWERLHDACAEELGIPGRGWPDDPRAH